MRDKYKDEDGEEVMSPFQGLEKAAVLQECRAFHDAATVKENPRKCCILITKLLFLLVKGDNFTSKEMTEVFFGVTKLFQSDDVSLRRMTYLFIKEVAETCDPDDIIIVTASLTKDMNKNDEDLYRANAMRVLAKIIDADMLGAIERYIKQAIVDRNAFVASSALMSGLRLFKSCPDIVRRWINEVTEGVNSSNDMVQYHALSLLYTIKQHDRLAVSKIVTQLSKGSLRSPLATCLLIRYTSNLLHEDMNATNARAAYSFLESCLRHKSDMVIFEAARTICNLPGVASTEITPAVNVMQLFITSNKASLRFAAMRTLSDVAAKHPVVVSKCNEEMEALVSDSNRSIATLAITTLLKTGNEGSVERLMKQISSFMGEIGDEFKIVVVKAIRELCIKYPAKHRVMVSFLATFLREEGGYEFKKVIVDSVVDLMSTIPDTKEMSLLHLCEFIEDCEFSELIVQILHLIGGHGPATVTPSKYIRFVFNRVILENAMVRAAAVSTLGAFATRVPELRQSCSILIKRSLTDEDDEVRDRAATILRSIETAADESDLRFLLDEPMPMTFGALELSINAFFAHESSKTDSVNGNLTFATLPVIEEVVPVSNASKKAGGGGASAMMNKNKEAAKKAGEESAGGEAVDPASELYVFCSMFLPFPVVFLWSLRLSLSLSTTTVCLHSLTPHDTSLTIISPSINAHITYNTGTRSPSSRRWDAPSAAQPRRR
jgi:coatomer protein complex subunit gamma